LRLKDAHDILMMATRVLGLAAAFLELVGQSNSSVTIDGGDLSKSAKPIIFSSGATPNAVRLRI
jgi:hypothetical protein